MKNIPAFKSQFKNQFKQYIEFKQMLGYKFTGNIENIRQLDVYIAALPTIEHCFNKELVEAYITRRPGENPSTQSNRVSTVRCFGKYLVRKGIEAYVLPNGVLPVAKYRFIPHIFNKEEVDKLLYAAESLPQRANSCHRHIVFPMMFKLIYGCGLRISEASNLLLGDVNLQNGVLLIRGTKFNKDRYTPMAQSLLQCCRRYTEEILAKTDVSSPFFPSPGNGFYSSSTIGHAFRQCLVIAGIPHYDDGPTVHSLRHSFAVRNLVKWSEENKDINAMLPYLSAYMGHENLLGTERYLRLTLEAFPQIRKQINAGCSWIMPEVACHEE